MGYLTSLDIGASALTAQRLRMDTITQNIANVNTTRAENGKPYKRKIVIFEEIAAANSTSNQNSGNTSNGASDANLFGLLGKPIGRGVRVAKIIDDNAPYRREYDPGNPDADAGGYVELPNVNIVTEMVNMISATRAYEANVTSINTTKGMAMKALEIGR